MTVSQLFVRLLYALVVIATASSIDGSVQRQACSRRIQLRSLVGIHECSLLNFESHTSAKTSADASIDLTVAMHNRVPRDAYEYASLLTCR